MSRHSKFSDKPYPSIDIRFALIPFILALIMFVWTGVKLIDSGGENVALTAERDILRRDLTAARSLIEDMNGKIIALKMHENAIKLKANKKGQKND